MFQDILKGLRIKHNYSQQDLGDLLGYSRAAISAYEIGRNEPSYEDLKRLAEFFSVSTDFLLGYSPEGKVFASLEVTSLLTKEQEALLERFGKLNPKGKKRIMEELEDMTELPKYTEEEQELKEKRA